MQRIVTDWGWPRRYLWPGVDRQGQLRRQLPEQPDRVRRLAVRAERGRRWHDCRLHHFSFEFDKADHLLVVEAFGKGPVEMSTGAVTSYAINLDGSLKVISGTVDTHQRETCWIAATDRYAYVTDFASHAITGYRIDMGGSLSLLNQDGVTAGTGEGTYPIDLAVAPDQQFLYVLLPGKSQVGIYRVNDDGSLASLGAVNGDWPIGMQGLAVN